MLARDLDVDGDCSSEVTSVVPLDRYVADGDLRAPDIIKVDVKGYEAELATGAVNALRQRPPASRMACVRAPQGADARPASAGVVPVSSCSDNPDEPIGADGVTGSAQLSGRPRGWRVVRRQLRACARQGRAGNKYRHGDLDPAAAGRPVVGIALPDGPGLRRAGAGRATISVVIPALDEAANLPHVLTRLPGSVDEVVLVDGHSIDATIEVARAILPEVRVVLQDGRGKGNALACGFAAACGDIIVMLDADGSADPAEIPRFVEVLLAGSDFAKGSRFAPGGGSSDITAVRRLGNRALLVLVNVLFGTRYSDLCYGYNAFWRHCLPHMHVDCDGFEVETLINVRVARAGLEVAEVPSVECERLFGESKLHAFRDGLRVLRTILCERVRRIDAAADPDGWRPVVREIEAAIEVASGHGPGTGIARADASKPSCTEGIQPHGDLQCPIQPVASVPRTAPLGCVESTPVGYGPAAHEHAALRGKLRGVLGSA